MVRVFLSGFLFFLTWTCGVHIVTIGAMNFVALYAVGAVALLAAALGAVRPGPITHVLTDKTLALPQPIWVASPTSVERKRLVIVLGVALVVFLVTAGIQYKFSRMEPFWLACFVVAGAALWSARYQESRKLIAFEYWADGATVHGRDAAFFVTVAGILAFYFFTSVPDPDDSLFLNLAVGAKEIRGPVFTVDTMLGIPDLEFIKSTYRLESYQLLAALISDISDLPVIFVAHTVVPGLICVWASSVLTLVHSALFPRNFGWTLSFHFALLVAMDGALQSYGYHAIPRFFQGKGPYVTVMVPLMTFLTWAAMKTGSWWSLIVLAGAVVISVGFTANAVYAAPLAIALVGATWLFIGGELRWHSFRLLIVVLYPAALALHLLINDPPGPSEHTSAGTIGGMMWGIWGSPPMMVVGLALLFIAMLSPLFSLKFSPVSVYFLVALAFILNPLLLPFYAEYVTGYINHRLFWAVPTVFFIAVMLGFLWSSRWLFAKFGVLVFLILSVLGPGSILHKAQLGFALLKVPNEEFQIAQRIVQSDMGNRLLLAPEDISAWVAALEGRPPLVEGRWLYIPQRKDTAYQEILDQRGEIYIHFNHKTDLFPNEMDFLTTASEVGVRAILLDSEIGLHAILENTLLGFGYEVIWRDGKFILLTL